MVYTKKVAPEEFISELEGCTEGNLTIAPLELRKYGIPGFKVDQKFRCG
jgi:hypothetical protein